MNTEFLMALIPGLLVVFLLIGVYKTVFEKKESAKEHIQHLLADPRAMPSSGGAGVLLGESSPKDRVVGELLKKRKKKKDASRDTLVDRLEIDLERANLMISATELMLISLVSGALAFVLLSFAFQLPLGLAILLALCALFVPRLMVKVKIMLRMKKAAAEFADVLDSMINGFKTGYGFSRAIQMVSENFHDPWGTEFGKMSAELNLGLTQEEALYNLAKRVPSADVDLFVTAMLIQKETGGNLSELLGTLSKTCRDRYKLYHKVSAISAQGKLSAAIVCCVPFVLAAMMFLFLPEAMRQFVTNPVGMILLILAGIWMVFGIGVLYKIVQIEV